MHTNICKCMNVANVRAYANVCMCANFCMYTNVCMSANICMLEVGVLKQKNGSNYKDETKQKNTYQLLKGNNET